MGIFQKLFDMFIRETHKLDQAAFLGKVKSSEQSDLGESLFDKHIQQEQNRVEATARKLEEKEEELQELKSEIPASVIRSTKPPPRKYKMVKMMYKRCQEQISELVSIQYNGDQLGMHLHFC